MEQNKIWLTKTLTPEERLYITFKVVQFRYNKCPYGVLMLRVLGNVRQSLHDEYKNRHSKDGEQMRLDFINAYRNPQFLVDFMNKKVVASELSNEGLDDSEDPNEIIKMIFSESLANLGVNLFEDAEL